MPRRTRQPYALLRDGYASIAYVADMINIESLMNEYISRHAAAGA